MLEGLPGALFMLLVTALEALEEDSSPVRVALILLAELGISRICQAAVIAAAGREFIILIPGKGFALRCLSASGRSYPVSAAYRHRETSAGNGLP